MPYADEHASTELRRPNVPVCGNESHATSTREQYEIDTHAIDLAARYDQASALLAYRSCLRAISAIGEVARAVSNVDFANCQSLYYASTRADHPRLADKFAWRKQHDFPVRWLGRAALKDEFGLTAPAAILSSVAARIDPYRLASRLLRRMQRRGTRVFDRTRVKSIRTTARSVQLATDSGLSIRARHAVIANGYEAQRWLRQRVAQNRSSYAYISDPVDRVELGWLASTLVWESARPYLYLRSTGSCSHSPTVATASPTACSAPDCCARRSSAARIH